MASYSLLRYFAALLFCGGLYFGFVAAQEGNDKKEPVPAWQLPKILDSHKAPTTVEELRDIENHVKKVLEKVMPAVVGVRVGPGSGSGVIVNEDGTILTAGHVSGNPGQNADVILAGGKTLKGGAKTLGKNGGIDSGMMKISVEGKYPFLEMAKSADLKVGQWVIAVGHPGGYKPNRGPVVRVGRILFVNQFVIRTDCTLVGGDSGGPLFDMQGRVIGIHSRIGGAQITENMHVPIDTYTQTWDKLAKGESWGGQLGQPDTVKGAGGKVVFEKKDSLTKEDKTQPSPKDANQKSFFKTFSFRMKAGHTYTLDLISGDKTGKKLDPYLRVELNGKKIAEDDDGGGFPHSRIVHKSMKDADYSIIATSYEVEQTGAFTLKIQEADFKDALVTGKVEILRAVKLPQPAVISLVEKFAQAKVPLHINAILVDDKGNPQPGKEITVQWDKGKETFKSNDAGIIRWPLAKDKFRKLNVEFPKGIRAMMALTDPEGNSIGLKFGDNDPSIEKVKGAGGNVVKTFDGSIAKTDPFDVERDKCHRHHHEFKMSAGKTYTFDLISEDFDAYLRVENDDKGKLAEDDDGGGFLNSRIVFTPPADGAYRLVVTTCDPGQLGSYRLAIRETDAKPAESKD